MAKHSFTVNVTEPMADTLAKAKRGIEKFGGSFEGDAEKGNLVAVTPAGKVTGTYRVEGQAIAIDITDKPFVVPGSMIEAQVRKFLGG